MLDVVTSVAGALFVPGSNIARHVGAAVAGKRETQHTRQKGQETQTLTIQGTDEANGLNGDTLNVATVNTYAPTPINVTYSSTTNIGKLGSGELLGISMDVGGGLAVGHGWQFMDNELGWFPGLEAHQLAIYPFEELNSHNDNLFPFLQFTQTSTPKITIPKSTAPAAPEPIHTEVKIKPTLDHISSPSTRPIPTLQTAFPVQTQRLSKMAHNAIQNIANPNQNVPVAPTKEYYSSPILWFDKELIPHTVSVTAPLVTNGTVSVGSNTILAEYNGFISHYYGVGYSFKLNKIVAVTQYVVKGKVTKPISPSLIDSFVTSGGKGHIKLEDGQPVLSLDTEVKAPFDTDIILDGEINIANDNLVKGSITSITPANDNDLHNLLEPQKILAIQSSILGVNAISNARLAGPAVESGLGTVGTETFGDVGIGFGALAFP